MSDLPPLDHNLFSLCKEIGEMRRGGSKENQKPHKLFMLLAVLDLFDQKLLSENRIFFNQQLIKNFEKYFRIYADDTDWCQPGPPFFHLRSASFWNHEIKPGREAAYSKLVTSGGGVKRIKDNIEYAFFDDSSYYLLCEESNREYLRNYIIKVLGELANLIDTERIPTVFHESFALSRYKMAQVINSLAQPPQYGYLRSKEKREKYFREHTQLGLNYVKAMPEYAKGSGLLSFEYDLTNFGEALHQYDPLLEQLSTQWLMHYHLSAPHGPGPIFWNNLVVTHFRSGDEFSQKQLAQEIGEIYAKDKGKSLSPNSATSTANAFLETYVKSDGLGNLGILEEIGDNYYRVQETDSPPIWVVAIAVLDYWQSHFPKQVTVNLSSLTSESGLASLFKISRSRLDIILGEMREIGVVELFRVAPPYQVALLDSDPTSLFRRMYSYE